MREALANPKWIKTPLLLMAEQDTPIVCTGEYVSWNGITVDTARPIPWTSIFELVLSGDANAVRLYHRADGIPSAHTHLMKEKFEFRGERFLKTLAWSQRPHIASTEYYREALSKYFSPQANTFIEDRLMTFVEHQSWDSSKVVIYWPSDGEAMRSWHSDGRADKNGIFDEKFEDKLIF